MLLIDTHTDGYESDRALAVQIHFEAHRDGPSPVVTFNGPDGEVELIGEVEIRAVMAAIEKQLGYIAARAVREVEVA